MDTNRKQRNFSMKYCPDLEDHVVVMTTAQGDLRNRVCLSSHLCRNEIKTSCPHENTFGAGCAVRVEETHFQ